MNAKYVVSELQGWKSTNVFLNPLHRDRNPPSSSPTQRLRSITSPRHHDGILYN